MSSVPWLYFLFLNSSTLHIFVILEHTENTQTVCCVIYAYTGQCQPLQEEEISCDKYRRRNDIVCCQWADWPGEKWWKRERENEREKGEAGGVWHYSITIRAVLDFSTFQNKETNFSQSPSRSHRKNHIIFSRQPPYNSEHCGILLLKLCIFKYQVKLQKGVIIFSTAFFYT